jgi:hypothetical protein
VSPCSLILRCLTSSELMRFQRRRLCCGDLGGWCCWRLVKGSVFSLCHIGCIIPQTSSLSMAPSPLIENKKLGYEGSVQIYGWWHGDDFIKGLDQYFLPEDVS